MKSPKVIRQEETEALLGVGPRSGHTVSKSGSPKQGSTLVRWSAIEAASRYHGGPPIRDTYRRVAERRGRNVGRVAAARKLLTLVYYGLRDHEIRCLHPGDAGEEMA